MVASGDRLGLPVALPYDSPIALLVLRVSRAQKSGPVDSGRRNAG